MDIENEHKKNLTELSKVKCFLNIVVILLEIVFNNIFGMKAFIFGGNLTVDLLKIIIIFKSQYIQYIQLE